MKPFPQLQSDRLLLRRFRETDLMHVFAGLSDPLVTKYYGVHYHTLEAAKEQMNFFSDLLTTDLGIWWAICSPGDNHFYGAGGLNNLCGQHQKAEIGFWLLRQYWQQGLMSEAMLLICNYGFSILQLHRLEALVETENTKSKKLLAKLGFEQEGTLRDCEIKNGKFISLHLYARLKPVIIENFQTSVL